MRPTLDDSSLVEGSQSRRDLLTRFSGDPKERRRALLDDPGLAVRGGLDAGFDDSDVEEIRRSVNAARRLLGVEGATGRRESHRSSGLAAALVALLVLLVPVGVERDAGPTLAVPSQVAELDAAIITHPAVEAIDLPEARVYELADEDFSVVLIVDDSFDL